MSVNDDPAVACGDGLFPAFGLPVGEVGTGGAACVTRGVMLRNDLNPTYISC